MKSYLVLALAFLVQAALVFASHEYPYSSTFYGCPDECESQEDPKCEVPIPSNKFFVALHPKYFKSKPYKYCSHYYVGMIIDNKASGKYKMVRAKVIDQCGTCDETQVDLSQTLFETLADADTGVVNMVYGILDKDSSEFIDGPHYNSSALKEFSAKQGVDRETIIGSFKQAARAMNKDGAKGMSDYPWKKGYLDKDSSASHDSEEKSSKKTTTKKTTTKKTTTTIVKKTTTIGKIAIPTIKTLAPKVTATAPNAQTTPVAPNAQTTPVAPKKEEPVTPKKEEQKEVPKVEEEELDEFDKKNGGTTAPVTAGIGLTAVASAAGVGLLLLKKKSPQKYDDLKQKFPEAFGTVKRSITRGASTIKRGVTRSVSRRGNQTQAAPLPASYTFTLNSEDGLPRVALYDDPYPTKTNGAQHW